MLCEKYQVITLTFHYTLSILLPLTFTNNQTSLLYSAFVAPRGASSSKYFTCIVCMVAVAGFLGAHRWARVGNGSELETNLSLAGFSCLLLVALFELDVRPEMFLDDKLMMTGWLIQKLKLEHLLDFDSDDFRDEKFINFIRKSKEIYHLYDEDQEIRAVQLDESIHEFKYNKATVWSSMHMVGATAYVVFVTASVLLHDEMSKLMVLITSISFTLFSLMGYLTGNYLYVLSYFRCWILTWNPFVKDRDFMKHLKLAVLNYARDIGKDVPGDSSEVVVSSTRSSARKRKSTTGNSSTSRKSAEKSAEKTTKPVSVIDVTSEDANQALDTFLLRWAHRRPKHYLAVIGHILVLSELVALLTPAIAMGLQWTTALCKKHSLVALVEIFSFALSCLFKGACEPDFRHCILTHA